MSRELIESLRKLGGRTRKLNAGAFLFRRDAPVRSLFLVETGEAHLVRFQADGSQLILQRAEAGQVLAEASVFSARYHCDGLVTAQSAILEIERKRFRTELLACERLAEEWGGFLAREVQSIRLRAEILALKTVSGRLDAWLSFHPEGFPGKGEWKVLAAQIGVTPEALYREFAKRAKDAGRKSDFGFKKIGSASGQAAKAPRPPAST
ncbi:MAG: Crp/Fnr family transcriptional regulator [Beijerinckiaceae bacterium]